MSEPAKPVPSKAEGPEGAPKPPEPAKPVPSNAEGPVSPVEARRQRIAAREKELADALATRLGDAVKGRSAFRDQQVIVVDAARSKEALRVARDELGFEMLADVTAIDYLKLDGHPERFAVVWNLLSLRDEARLRLKAYVSDEDPRIESCADLWPAGNWGEREAFDMFGIHFDGHPNLKRILMPEDYGSYPLRKDYPLRGRGERDNFAVLKRGSKEEER